MNARSRWMWIVCGCLVAAMAMADVSQAQPGGPGGRGDRGPGGDRRGGWGQPRELTEEQREQAMAVLKDMNKPMYDRMQQAIEENPERAERFVGMMWGRLEHLVEMKKNDPIHYRAIVKSRKLDGELRTLRQQIRQAQQAGDEAKAEQVTMKLRDLLEERFEVQQTLDAKKLERMKKDVDKLKEKIESDETRKDEIVDEQLAKYLKAEYDREIDGWRRPDRDRRGDRGERGDRGDRDAPRDRWNRGGDRDGERPQRPTRERD